MTLPPTSIEDIDTEIHRRDGMAATHLDVAKSILVLPYLDFISFANSIGATPDGLANWAHKEYGEYLRREFPEKLDK